MCHKEEIGNKKSVEIIIRRIEEAKYKEIQAYKLCRINFVIARKKTPNENIIYAWSFLSLTLIGNNSV